MKKLAIILAALGLGFVIVHEARAASAWVDMGEADNVKVWRFQDGAHVCYVSSSGGIACPK